MSDMWTERLSEYLDEELAPEERAALAAHLERCPECSATLADLRRVVARARALESGGPSSDLWPGIAQRIGAGPAPARSAPREPFRRVTLSLPQLLAAGIALMVLSGGSVWLLRPSGRPAGPPVIAALPSAPAVTSAAAAAGSTGTAVSWQRRAAPGYDAAVAELEQVLQQGRGRLDSTTVRVLEQNLQVIDRAIEQARRAVAADSANAYLNSHLAETMRQKLDLLRQAASLVSAAS